MYQPIINRSYLTEVLFTNTPSVGMRVMFLDIPQLRNVTTVGLECFTATQLTTSPNSKVVVTAVTGIVLTLAIGNVEEVFQVPCIDLVPGSNSGLIRLLKNKTINLPKSYITVLDATGLVIDTSVLFNFIYEPGRS